MIKDKKNTKAKSLYIFEPWSYLPCLGKAQISAYVMASGKREIIAETFSTQGHSAEALADFIIQAVNNLDKKEALINELVMALEICLAREDGLLEWSAEHGAEVALRHVKENRIPVLHRTRSPQAVSRSHL